MLLQTNSYIVPKERRAEHARLLRRFRSILSRLGCDQFEVYEQMGPNWNTAEATGRFVQIMRFRDRKHQRAVHAAEQTDPAAQQLINEFCELINLPYQQQQGLLAIGYYNAVPEASAGKPRAAAAAAVEPPPPPRRPTMSAGFGFTGPAAGAAALSAAIPPYGTTDDEQDLAAEQSSDGGEESFDDVDPAAESTTAAWQADPDPPVPAYSGPATVVPEVAWAEPEADEAASAVPPAMTGSGDPVPASMDAVDEWGPLGDDLPAWEDLADQPEDAPPAVAPVMADPGEEARLARPEVVGHVGTAPPSLTPAPLPDDQFVADHPADAPATGHGLPEQPVAAGEAADPFDVDDLLSEWGGAGGAEAVGEADNHFPVGDLLPGPSADAVEAVSSDNPHSVAEGVDAFDLPDTTPEAHPPTGAEDMAASLPVATGTAGAEGDVDALADDPLFESASETPTEDAASASMSQLQAAGPEAGIDDLAAFAIGHSEGDQPAALPSGDDEPAALRNDHASQVETDNSLDALEPDALAATASGSTAATASEAATPSFGTPEGTAPTPDGLPTRLSTDEGDIEIVFESIPEGVSSTDAESAVAGETGDARGYELDAVFDEALSGEGR